MTSKIVDLGFVGDIARCPKCGARVDGQFSRYVAGSPGLNEYRSDCPKCGAKLRFTGDSWFAGYPDFEWVSPNGKWAIMGVYDGPVLDFDDAVAHIELAWPEGDNSVPIIILRDGTIVWGYDEDYRRSDYPAGVAAECERRLRERYAQLFGGQPRGIGSNSVRSMPRTNPRTKSVHGKPGASTQQAPTGFNRDAMTSGSRNLRIADSGRRDGKSRSGKRSRLFGRGTAASKSIRPSAGTEALAADLVTWLDDFDHYEFADSYDSWEDAYRDVLYGLGDASYVRGVISYLEEVDDIDYDDGLEARRRDILRRLRALATPSESRKPRGKGRGRP